MTSGHQVRGVGVGVVNGIPRVEIVLVVEPVIDPHIGGVRKLRLCRTGNELAGW